MPFSAKYRSKAEVWSLWRFGFKGESGLAEESADEIGPVLDGADQLVEAAGGEVAQAVFMPAHTLMCGSISLTVFPAVLRERLSDGESVERGFPAHHPPGLAGAGGVEGTGDQIQAL